MYAIQHTKTEKFHRGINHNVVEFDTEADAIVIDTFNLVALGDYRVVPLVWSIADLDDNGALIKTKPTDDKPMQISTNRADAEATLKNFIEHGVIIRGLLFPQVGDVS